MAAADGRTPYLATIAIERAPGGSALGEDMLATLHVRDSQKALRALGRIDGLDVLGSDEQTVRVRYSARPTFSDSPGELLQQSTWVVDYDDASVQALLTQLSPGDTRPSPASLERFVFEHVTSKSYSRAFDLASRVAATREGDCTEHAVLLAAMARASGYPARVVFGNLVLERDDELAAFGHAWVEIHDGDDWQIRDATMPPRDSTTQQSRYLPVGVLTDEGPGYALSLVQTMSAMPMKITDVAGSGLP
jgi:hypothetical protein